MCSSIGQSLRFLQPEPVPEFQYQAPQYYFIKDANWPTVWIMGNKIFFLLICLRPQNSLDKHSIPLIRIDLSSMHSLFIYLLLFQEIKRGDLKDFIIFYRVNRHTYKKKYPDWEEPIAPLFGDLLFPPQNKMVLYCLLCWGNREGVSRGIFRDLMPNSLSPVSIDLRSKWADLFHLLAAAFIPEILALAWTDVFSLL